MEQKFTFNNLPVRTITGGDDQTWFAGIDVCNILEYQNSTDIIEKKLDDDEKKLDYLVDSSGQKRKTWTINESGLYSLILTSSKPEAKVFKRWVTHEVLPSIRRAGKYSSEDEKQHEMELQSVADEIQRLKDSKDEYQRQVNELKKQIESQTSRMIALIKRDKNQLKLFLPDPE